MPPPKTLPPGVYVPTTTIFTPTDDIDKPATATHAQRLAHAHIAGLVVQGSNGEAIHLDRQDRLLVTHTTREALDALHLQHVPLIVGCGAQSTRETLSLCCDAAAHGGSHALVLPPSYYRSLLTMESIIRFYTDVADNSPIPLVVYNFPSVCGGLDLDSDTILTLARHPNIVGVKLTCGNTGKLARIVAGCDAEFRVLAGSADFIVQALSVGGHGVVAGLANLVPRTCVELIRLCNDGRAQEARKLQAVVAAADWVAIRGGFVSVKAALQRFHGYGGRPRAPCVLPEGRALEEQMEGFAEVVRVEGELMAAGGGETG
ncbi:hypothetical protein CDD80_916 [Ophiocordyceps camponoti-rufipedis]|uniref:4-hydroxy-2-oxoglutarate aldolase, mitochondrial n=1 Tax=Ophiocordyceps camponoti-rufipedis TaxID=2004952 RepID=A0A2C5YIA4_9HYPO|nr:hypothetical protein CDD80_916 [Ophiocordyceps camponoti-rufipedis]